MRTQQPAEDTQCSRRGARQHPPPEPAALGSRLHLWLPAFLPVASFALSSPPPPPRPAAEHSPRSAPAQAYSAVTGLSFDKLCETRLTLLRHPSVYMETSKTAGDLIWHLIRRRLTAVFVIFIRGKSGTLETTAVSPFLTLLRLKGLCSFHRSPGRLGAGKNIWPFRKV